jgi:hypothetical protein
VTVNRVGATGGPAAAGGKENRWLQCGSKRGPEQDDKDGSNTLRGPQGPGRQQGQQPRREEEAGRQDDSQTGQGASKMGGFRTAREQHHIECAKQGKNPQAIFNQVIVRCLAVIGVSFSRLPYLERVYVGRCSCLSYWRCCGCSKEVFPGVRQGSHAPPSALLWAMVGAVGAFNLPLHSGVMRGVQQVEEEMESGLSVCWNCWQVNKQ